VFCVGRQIIQGGDPNEALVQRYRLDSANFLATASCEHEDLRAALADEIAASPVAADPRVVALLADLNGQVKQAFSKSEWFSKWGTHYLPSLSRSHTMQQCSNFKDPGLQVYGGAAFKAIRDDGDDIFVDLPPPTPTGRPQVVPTGSSLRGIGSSRSPGVGASAASAPIDMSRYVFFCGSFDHTSCAD